MFRYLAQVAKLTAAQSALQSAARAVRDPERVHRAAEAARTVSASAAVALARGGQWAGDAIERLARREELACREPIPAPKHGSGKP